MHNAQDSAPRRGRIELLVARDPDEAEELVRPRSFRFVPRGPEPFGVEIRRIAGRALDLRVERTLGATLVHACPAAGTQSIFTPGPQSGGLRYAGRRVEPSHVALTHADEGWHGVLPNGFQAFTVGFDREALRGYCADLGVEDPIHLLERRWILPPAPTLARQVGAMMRAAEALPVGWDARTIEEAAFDLVLSVISPRGVRPSVRVSAAHRRRALSRAIDYALGHLGAPPRVADLCRVAGTSVRTLEYAFREAYDTTPVGFLRTARLSRARLDLARASREETTVLQVALRWGFHSPARFAREYTLRFGERPSATLRRAPR